MRGIIAFLTILSIFLTPPIFAADWYVRPEGGNYGKEDGTSYENGWDGLLNIVWGAGGVQAGDTLYICGTHIHKMTHTRSIEDQANILLGSGSPDNRITIRGDYSGDEGVVWGAYIPKYEAWQYEGSYTYSITLEGATQAGWIFEDINGDSYTLLKKKSTLQECKSNPGTFYSSDYREASKFYVHCSDNGDPTDRIALNRYGYQFWFQPNVGYITFKNITICCHYRFDLAPDNNSDYITWDNVILHIAPGTNGFDIKNGNDHLTWRNCTIEYVMTGIYFVAQGVSPPSSYQTFQNCVIRECGTSDNTEGASPDLHGIGIQGGHDILIENNEIYRCKQAIVFYVGNTMSLYNSTTRCNYIHDLLPMGNSGGIYYGADTEADLGNTSGNKCYHNILVGNGQLDGKGIYYKYESNLECYNNVIYNFEKAIRCKCTNNYQDGPGITLKNNIIFNSGLYHIEIEANALTPSNYNIDSDYNIFYPILGKQFRFTDSQGTTYANLSEWQSFSRIGCTFDPNSSSSDPKLINGSGAYSRETDFQLQNDSPSIDAGTDVGITQDYAGTPIPQGFAPDIGAFEYNGGTYSLYANISATPISGYAPLTVSFDAIANGGTSPYSYSWNFGDGNSSSEQNPFHTYSGAGTYVATFTVTDAQSNQASDSLTITVTSGTSTQQLSLSTATGAPAPGIGGTTNPIPGRHSYPTGSAVSLSAISNTDYRFSSWSGDLIATDIYNEQVTINMDTDKSLEAYFCAKCGDVNGDLKITASDAQAAFDIFLGRISNPTPCEIENSDVSCDGNVTPGDAQAVFNKFLNKGELPTDCSGKTRSQIAALSPLQTEVPSIIHLIIENTYVNTEGYAYVPIIIDNPLNIDAFGFDLHFPHQVLEFVTYATAELLMNFTQLKAYQPEEGMLIVGGYSISPLTIEYPEVIMTLVFRPRGKLHAPVSLIITKTYDDIKNATVTNGTITERIKGESDHIYSFRQKEIQSSTKIHRK